VESMLRLVGQRAMRQVTQVGTIRQLAGAAAKEEVVDWDEMAKLVTTAAGKRELSQLRSTIQDLIQKATVPKSEPIDWEKFKKETGMPELVSAYEKAFKGMVFPKYPGTEIADCMAELKALEQSIDKDIEASKPELVRIEKELAKLEQMDEAIEDMKLDEFVAAYGNTTEGESTCSALCLPSLLSPSLFLPQTTMLPTKSQTKLHVPMVTVGNLRTTSKCKAKPLKRSSRRSRPTCKHSTW